MFELLGNSILFKVGLFFRDLDSSTNGIILFLLYSTIWLFYISWLESLLKIPIVSGIFFLISYIGKTIGCYLLWFIKNTFFGSFLAAADSAFIIWSNAWSNSFNSKSSYIFLIVFSYSTIYFNINCASFLVITTALSSSSLKYDWPFSFFDSDALSVSSFNYSFFLILSFFLS